MCLICAKFFVAHFTHLIKKNDLAPKTDTAWIQGSSWPSDYHVNIFRVWEVQITKTFQLYVHALERNKIKWSNCMIWFNILYIFVKILFHQIFSWIWLTNWKKYIYIIPDETIEVWAKGRRFLCKIFFYNPSDLDVNGNQNPSNIT